MVDGKILRTHGYIIWDCGTKKEDIILNDKCYQLDTTKQYSFSPLGEEKLKDKILVQGRDRVPLS